MKKRSAAVLLLLLAPACLAYVSGGRSTPYDSYRACSHNQFRCRSGQCIENGQRCNGIPECHDRSDELNCPRCRQDEFTCLDGSCIGANARCDGRRDCVDYSDERDCNVTTCNSDQFRCNDGICLSIDKRCNEVTDCRAGEDEENCDCKSSEFRCTDGRCIGYELQCNGREDCADGSDEKECVHIVRLKRSVNKDSKHRGKTGRKRKKEWEIIKTNDFVDKQLRGLKHLPLSSEPEINETTSNSNQNKMNKKRAQKKKKKEKTADRGDFPLKENKTFESYTSEIVTTKGSKISEKITKLHTIETTEVPVKTAANIFRPNWFEFVEKVFAKNMSYTPKYSTKPGSSIDNYFKKYNVKKQKFSNAISPGVIYPSVSYEKVNGVSDFKEKNCQSKECRYFKLKSEKLLSEFELLKKQVKLCGKNIGSGVVESLEDAKDRKENNSEYDIEIFTDAEKWQSEEKIELTTSSIINDVEIFDIPGNKQKKSGSIAPNVSISKTRPRKVSRKHNTTKSNRDRSKNSTKITLPTVELPIENISIRSTKHLKPFTTPRTKLFPVRKSLTMTTGYLETTKRTPTTPRTTRFVKPPSTDPKNNVFFDDMKNNVVCSSNPDDCEDNNELPIPSNRNINNPKEKKKTFGNYGKVYRGSPELSSDEDDSKQHEVENIDLDPSLSVANENSEEYDDDIDNETMEIGVIRTLNKCSPGRDFVCKNGACIQDERRCDGRIDCSDGSDEDLNICRQACKEEGQKLCDNGVCISQAFFCDGNSDCLDNSDEKDCKNIKPAKPPYVCQRSDFTCHDRTCVPHLKVCDGVSDCPDGSDESECFRGCKQGQFQCSNGDCIQANQQCNRVIDCDDGSDEDNCASTNNQEEEERGPGYHPMPGHCPHGRFRCNSDNSCVPHSARCNGIPECRDASDERDCGDTTTHTELNLKTYPSEQVIKESREVVFQCRDEGPLRARVRWLKDGQPLPAGSRDLNGRLEIPNIQIADAGDYICEAIDHPRLPNRQVRVHLVVERREEPLTRPPLVCKYEEATCSNGDCIPKNQICDGKYDCTDGSDEMRCSLHGCEPNEFRCANKQCISKIWRCDGDKDCVDGSDEENCAQAPIGSPCRYGEFQCHSRSQCIPKSYHCDSERDCFDGSDELGCMAVSIVKSPPPMIYLNQYDTLELSCTAIGVPTPEINYRLNWGHVPSKCKIQSQNGTGTLTCPEITFSDQGAYSCEAINIIGFTFAVPDTILMVKQPESVCPRGTFNSEAKSPEECISCFCFGATNNCTSANLFTYQLPPPFDSYRMVQVETFPRIRLIWNNTEGSLVEILPFGRDGVRAYDRYYSNTNYTVPYFVLPESHHGNQLKSYGGYLRYTLKFNGTRTLNTAPAVILSGNGLTLVHKGGQVSPGYSNEESVRLFEGEWYKVEGRYEEPASREEIMMALANVENILIKLKYDDEQLLDTALINIVMDTADVTNTGLGAASFVEECSCPTGYSGDSCERCAPGFIRQKTGAWLGHCAPESPIVCPPGHFGDPSRNIPCKLCPCPLTNPSNQFARTCHLGSDGNPTCDCPVGYDGRRCEKCAPDYRGNPLIPGDMCVPLGPQCDPRGSLSSSPDPLTGRCRCKAHATGSICDQCKANTFSLATSNQFGCLSCFCMGITTTCSASNWFRNEIKVSFTNSVRNFSIIESTHPNARPIDHNIQLDSVNREIVYSEFPNRGDGNVYYWQLPSIFVGDQIASYGGFLKYTIRYVPSPGGLSSKNNAADVEIISANDRTLLYYSQESPNPNVPTPFEVPLLEQYWQRTDGTPVDRENLLMTLADIQTVRIKATYTTHTAEAALSRVSLDTAEKWNTGKGRAVEVEECSCPLGYKGLSCEDCDTGYSRIAMGIHLGMCEPCNCNGHSNQCNPETGVCENCAHHTMGPNCELCEPGYQGNATRGTPSDCSYAPGNAPGRHTECYCDLAGSRSTSCENNKCDCKRNVVGERCNRCRPDTFGLSASNPDGCNECFCNGLTNQCHESSLYLQQIPMIVYDDSHGFILTDSSRREIINQDFELNIALSRIGYRYPRGRSSARLFWSLSSSFTGNKVKSYGGNLSITQQISTNENARIYQDQDVILIGNGVTLFWMNPVAIESGVPLVYKVSLREGDWRRLNNEGHRTASRADLMTVLSNLEAILVRATFSDEMTATYISDVSMDTAVDTKTGLQRATQVEICRCPQGYTGTSCESCSRGYYRDISDRSHSILGVCKPCPCNGKEESCEMNRHGHVVCHCSRGSAGANCEEAEGLTVKPLPSGGSAKIHITIREPEFQIVEVGSTVRYHCSGTSVDNTAVNVRWNKEGGPLPSDRSMDDNHGLLIIRDLKVTDSGVYVCEVSDGVNIGLKRVSLTVGGTHAEAPRATINPSSIEVREGDPVEMHCVATGHPAPVLEWVRVHGRINPEANFYNGVWRLPYALKSDAAEYICIARNNIGVHEERTILYVRDGPKRPDTSSLSLRPTISPSEWTGPAGQSVYLSCSGSNMTKFAWSRLGGISLQRTASERYGVLTITNPSVSDSGIYVCTATSSENTETSSTARVTIVPPTETPIIKAMPERQTVPQGSTAEIRCADAFRNNFTVKWWRFGATSLRPNVVQIGESLRISNIQMEDRGVYVCTASNDRNTVETSATVEVDYREPPALEVYPRDVQTVYPGGSADMQCRATAGQPAPEVYWTREDGRSFHSNVEQLPGGLLRIRNVSLEDEGGYVCTATNPVGTVATVARIQVHSPPVVSIDPDREVLQVRLGQKVRLVCSATGRPVPNVAWTKHTHGSSMHEPFNRLATIPHSAVQEIVSVSLDDEGYYTCEGTNAAGTDTRRIEIRIEEDQDNTIDEQEPCRGDVPCPSEPQINAPDNDRGPSTNIVAIDEYKIPEGGTVEMRCRATGNGSDAFYLDWKRSNSRSLPQGSLISEGTLKISHVTKDAAGEYECLGVDQLGVVLFRAVSELVVISPPRIILHPPSQTVGPGENPYIQCSASGDQPIHIEWIAVGRASPITKSYNGILQFHSITFEDAGKYVCKARNEAGTAEAVAEVLVNDSEDFKNIHATEHDVSTIAGSSVRLTCRSQGPEINWSREGQSLPASHRTGEDYLELVHVRPEDSGRYICQIRNSQGVESRDYINLRVSAASSPYVTVKSSHDFANIGDTVDLNCQSYGTHNPRYHWIRENRLPLPSRSTVHGHNLRISNLEPNDGGNYICLVQSAENRYEGIYNLVVQDTSLLSSGDAPAIDVKTVKLGEQAVLECTAELKRPKKFEWRTNKDLPSSSKISNGNLIIRNVTEHEAGNYICVASNDQDSVEGPVVLVVTDVIPHFSQSQSYLELAPLMEHHLSFNIEVSFRPESFDGIILYEDEHVNGTGDFLMLALERAYPIMKFNLGSETATIKSNKSLELNKWHTIKLQRFKKEGIMLVDGQHQFTGTAEGKKYRLDLKESLFVGGVPHNRIVHKDVSVRTSMLGCISRIVSSDRVLSLMANKVDSYGLTSCESCDTSSCMNEGVCQPASTKNGYRCLCRAGFYGDLCENVGETCYPGACGEGKCVNTDTDFTCYCPLGKRGRRCEQTIGLPHLSHDKAFMSYKTPNDSRKSKRHVRKYNRSHHSNARSSPHSKHNNLHRTKKH